MSWKDPPKGTEQARRDAVMDQIREFIERGINAQRAVDEQGLTAGDKRRQWDGLSEAQCRSIQRGLAKFLEATLPADATWSYVTIVWSQRPGDLKTAADMLGGSLHSPWDPIEMLREWLEIQDTLEEGDDG